MPAEDRSSPPPAHRAPTVLLFFASGFVGLVYEVLWMKELGLLFGNTAQAAATTLAAFFLGLAAGARFWGRTSGRMTRPLRSYAYLELGVALSALLYFALLDAYHAIYSGLFALLGSRPSIFLIVKFVLALGVLLPPSFFMGGTLPVLSQHLVRRRQALGRVGSLLYGVNTLGAAAGAYVAGFHLPRWLGTDRAYFAALAVTVAVAVVAWFLGSEGRRDEGRVGSEREFSPGSVQAGSSLGALDWAGWSPATVRALALFSGFASLSLEVLWTRMFAQVLQNSVYTFATILVTFLLALALGSGWANWLMRKGYDGPTVLVLLLGSSAFLVGATPFAFYWLTDGLSYFGGGWSFGPYVLATFGGAFGVMLVPGICLGALFPYLLRLAEPFARDTGRTVGDLSAVNTLGGVAGSLTAGFVLLDLFGLWASIRLIAVGYLCVGLLVSAALRMRPGLARLLAVAGFLLFVTALDPSRLPVVRVDPIESGESVLRVWEGSSGIVSVVRRPESLMIKLDNDYSLGGTGAAKYEEGQAHLPLWLHAAPRSVFFLGMGTGITAGAALLHPVERVVVTELSADVVAAARTFFAPYVHGLFDDRRVAIVAEDGRNHLLATSETFDVIVADLFMTWKAGVGSLFSREHYEAARSRLRPDGLYVQWLPLYQVSRREFCVVSRTMIEVFPLVTAWRGAIAPGWETVALIGHQQADGLDRAAVTRRLAQSGEISVVGIESGDADAAAPSIVQRFALRDLIVQYAGNLTLARNLFLGCPLNTDDRPIIEYEAPIRQRRSRATGEGRLVGGRLVSMLAEILATAPPERDPYLTALSPPERQLVRGGLSLYASQILDRAGREEAARDALRRFEVLYAAADGSAGERGQELEQSRRELQQLIDSYEERIRGLRRHLREAEREAATYEAGTP